MIRRITADIPPAWGEPASRNHLCALAVRVMDDKNENSADFSLD